MSARYRRRRRSLALVACALVGAASLATESGALPVLPPNASITATPNPALVGEPVQFDGSGSTGDGLGGTIVRYEWDLDGVAGYELDTGGGPTVSRSYDAPATVTASLRVTDSDGDVDTASLGLRVHSAPSASFIFEPSTPAVGEPITFSSTSFDPDGPFPAGSHRWDLDGDGRFNNANGETTSESFATPGDHAVGLEVTDADGAVATVTRTVPVQDRPGPGPVAGFSYSPSAPLTAQTVAFDGSASTAPAGQTITGMLWDLDGDGGFDDAVGPSATFSYPTPGPRTIGLRVEASDGGSDVATAVVAVSNRAPAASFVYAPKSPRPGAPVRLTSTSSDPDGPLAEQAWDLDGDGGYDDAKGPTAKTRFKRAGRHEVGLQVRDSDGVTRERRLAIRVGGELELMNPFPIVRLSGVVRPSRKTVIKRLSVRAPKGSEVRVRCRGGSCPFDDRRRRVARARVGFPGLDGPLRPGTLIKVFVTHAGAIGKFTQFRIRGGKAPHRTDRCLVGIRPKPIRCP